MEELLSRAQLLIEQKKYKEAEKILKSLLSQDPNNVWGLLFLGEVYLQEDQNELALKVVNNAIGIAPDEAHLFHLRSRVHMQLEKTSLAIQDVQMAIKKEPYNADFMATLGHYKLLEKEFKSALEWSNRALQLDAENIIALNTRSTALLKLDQKEESYKTIKGALREDPNNPYTHANHGWGLLEQGEHKKAREHFLEALKVKPDYAYAKAGMQEAIKASNIFYRWFLKYAFFMSNLSSKYQWAVIIGIYLLVKALSFVNESYPALSPILLPVIILLGIFAFSTWIMNPIGNLFLRFNKYGSILLDRHEKISSVAVGVFGLISIIGFAAYFALSSELYLLTGFYGLTMMIPAGRMFHKATIKHLFLLAAIALGAYGAFVLYTGFSGTEITGGQLDIYIYGLLGFQIASNFLSIHR